MQNSKRFDTSILIALALIFTSQIHAASVQTSGAGSAVNTADRTATFTILDYAHNGFSLSSYTEFSLVISTSGDSYVGNPYARPYFDPFHVPGNPAPQGFYFPYGGTTEWITIRTSDKKTIYGLEFLYGNGWTTGDIYGVPCGNDNAYVTWRTLKSGKVVSSGTIGISQILPVGTVVGFYDKRGFDQLQLNCLSASSGNPALSALALDNVRVALTAAHARIP